MKRMLVLSAGVLMAATGAASAGATQYGVDASSTSTVMHGGNRELVSMGFLSNPSSFNGSNLLNFTSGTLTNNVGTYGWNAAIPRDMGGTNHVSGNPDRADAASAFISEGASTGTLAEVFAPFSSGYKNLSYIIDGEDSGAWSLDLFLAPGRTISADASATTVEIALLERGRNSDMNVYGINADGSLTSAVFIPRSNLGYAGWTLDTLEIDGAQQVGGVGLSLDPSWRNLKGFRIEALSSFNGPDLVAVAVATPVPGPSAGAALVGLGGVVVMRRRRK